MNINLVKNKTRAIIKAKPRPNPFVKENKAAQRIRRNLEKESSNIKNLLKTKRKLTQKEENLLARRLDKLIFIGEKRTERQLDILRKEKRPIAFNNVNKINISVINLTFLIRKLKKSGLVSKDFGEQIKI